MSEPCLKVINRVSNSALVIAGVLTLAMMFHVNADVAPKYIINQPVSATLEIVSTYHMVAVVFLLVAAVEFTRTLIAVGVVYQYLLRPVQLACMAPMLVACTGVPAKSHGVTFNHDGTSHVHRLRLTHGSFQGSGTPTTGAKKPVWHAGVC